MKLNLQITNEESIPRRQKVHEKVSSGKFRLPDAVKEMREAVGLSVEDFAKATGLSARQIKDIESGKSNPTVATLNKIGRLYNYEIGFVFKKRPFEDE